MKRLTLVKVIVVAPDDKVLIVRRSATDTRRPLKWDFPGGIVEDKEYTRQAAVRELKEETGIMVANAKLDLVFAASAIDEDLSITWEYFAVQVSETPAVSISYEHDQFAWLPVEEAIKSLEGTRQQGALRYISDHNVLTSESVTKYGR